MYDGKIKFSFFVGCLNEVHWKEIGLLELQSKEEFLSLGGAGLLMTISSNTNTNIHNYIQTQLQLQIQIEFKHNYKCKCKEHATTLYINK